MLQDWWCHVCFRWGWNDVPIQPFHSLAIWNGAAIWQLHFRADPWTSTFESSIRKTVRHEKMCMSSDDGGIFSYYAVLFIYSSHSSHCLKQNSSSSWMMLGCRQEMFVKAWITSLQAVKQSQTVFSQRGLTHKSNRDGNWEQYDQFLFTVLRLSAPLLNVNEVGGIAFEADVGKADVLTSHMRIKPMAHVRCYKSLEWGSCSVYR